MLIFKNWTTVSLHIKLLENPQVNMLKFFIWSMTVILMVIQAKYAMI